jgi:hypothetical protein
MYQRPESSGSHRGSVIMEQFNDVRYHAVEFCFVREVAGECNESVQGAYLGARKRAVSDIGGHES